MVVPRSCFAGCGTPCSAQMLPVGQGLMLGGFLLEPGWLALPLALCRVLWPQGKRKFIFIQAVNCDLVFQSGVESSD